MPNIAFVFLIKEAFHTPIFSLLSTSLFAMFKSMIQIKDSVTNIFSLRNHTESQNYRGQKEPLEITESNLLLKQVPAIGCTHLLCLMTQHPHSFQIVGNASVGILISVTTWKTITSEIAIGVRNVFTLTALLPKQKNRLCLVKQHPEYSQNTACDRNRLPVCTVDKHAVFCINEFLMTTFPIK